MPQYPGFNICTFTALVRNAQNGLYATSSFYWEATSQNVNASNIVAACDAFKSQLAAVLCPLLSTSCALNVVSARVFAQNAVIEGLSTTAANTGQEDSTDCLPMSSTLVVAKKTTQFGRSKQGRYFFAGIGEAVQENGLVASGYVNAAKALATFLGADRTFTVPFHARHWDRKNNVFVPISSCLALSKIGTLRSRNKRVRAGYL
jgi:hypothetical protein